MADTPPPPPDSPDVEPTHISAPGTPSLAATHVSGEVRVVEDVSGEATVRVSPTPLVGRYQVRRELGRGGMGRVLVAFDSHLGREVAIKELIDPSPEARDRFEREVLVTARLQHPSIVPVYEATRGAGGDPFYVMPQIPGKPLTAALSRARALPDRLALLPQVIAACEAMAYAHEHGVIHRDLKPDNILVGSFGETVVIDWGLAKVIELADVPSDPGQAPRSPLVSARDAPGHTRTGNVMGTPSYMAPEQARGKRLDARCDVYSLGAILWHLFTGAPPYAEDDLIRMMEALVKGPPPEPRWAGTPRDLVAIIRKATAHDPARRYLSGAPLLADLRRFHSGQQVEAQRYSAADLAARWLGRHRALVATGGLATLGLVAMGAISLARVVAARRVAEQARDQAESLQRRAELDRQQALILQARGQVDADPTGTLQLLRTLSPKLPGWEQARFIAEEAFNHDPASWSLHIPGASAMAATHDGRRAVIGTQEGQLWVWDLESKGLHNLGSQGAAVTGITVGPGDDRLLALGDDGRAWLWTLDSGASQLIGSRGDPVSQAAFLADGSIGLLRDSLTLEVWRTDPLALVDQLTGLDWARASAFGGALLVRRGARATLIRGSRDQAAFELPQEWGNPALSRDGTSVLASNLARGLALIDVHSGKATLLDGLHRDHLYLSHQFLDSGTAASLVDRRTLDTWARGTTVAAEKRLDCDAVEIRPLSGDRVMFACDDALEIVELSTGRKQILPVHGAVGSVTSPDGNLVLSRGDPDHVWVWNLRDLPAREVMAGEPVDYVLEGDAELTPLVVGGGQPSTLFSMDPSTRALRPLAQVSAGISSAAISPDGDSVAWVENGTTGVSWMELRDGQRRHAATPEVHTVDFFEGGKTLLAATAHGPVAIDVESGAVRGAPDGGDVSYAALPPGSSTAVTVATEGHHVAVNTLDGSAPRAIDGLGEGLYALTRDGRWWLNAHRSGAIDAWSTRDWSAHALKSGAHRVTAFTVLPDGTAAVSADVDGSLWVSPLDGSPGRPVTTLATAAYALEPSGDSRSLACIDTLGLVTVVDVASGATWELRDSLGPFDSTSHVARPPSWLTTRNDGVRFWVDDLPREPQAILDRIARVPQVVEPTPPLRAEAR